MVLPKPSDVAHFADFSQICKYIPNKENLILTSGSRQHLRKWKKWRGPSSFPSSPSPSLTTYATPRILEWQSISFGSYYERDCQIGDNYFTIENELMIKNKLGDIYIRR